MVTINGLSRNMGHDMLVDRDSQYRYLAVEVFNDQITREYCLERLVSRDDSKMLKRSIWLHLMGLMETSDTPGYE